MTPTGVKSLSTVKRPDGRRQVAYKGGPLYTFVEDKKPGDMKGNGFKDVGTLARDRGRRQGSAPDEHAADELGGELPGGYSLAGSTLGPACTKRPGGGLLADRLIARPSTATGELARRRLCVAELDLRPRDEALVVEPVQELAVVLGEPDDRRLRGRPRARRAAPAPRSRPARTSGSTGQPCGQRSGLPSLSSIRSTMSSENVSPSSSAWTCASAAV